MGVSRWPARGLGGAHRACLRHRRDCGEVGHQQQVRHARGVRARLLVGDADQIRKGGRRLGGGRERKKGTGPSQLGNRKGASGVSVQRCGPRGLMHQLEILCDRIQRCSAMVPQLTSVCVNTFWLVAVMLLLGVWTVRRNDRSMCFCPLGPTGCTGPARLRGLSPPCHAMPSAGVVQRSALSQMRTTTPRWVPRPVPSPTCSIIASAGGAGKLLSPANWYAHAGSVPKHVCATF